jgi:site-specific DNA-methyltransferase (adenine-specific)
MGSGSTIIACLETNRKYIGIEKNEYFFKQAEERIQEHIKGNKDHAPTIDINKKYIYIE